MFVQTPPSPTSHLTGPIFNQSRGDLLCRGACVQVPTLFPRVFIPVSLTGIKEVVLLNRNWKIFNNRNNDIPDDILIRWRSSMEVKKTLDGRLCSVLEDERFPVWERRIHPAAWRTRAKVNSFEKRFPLQERNRRFPDRPDGFNP